jgi:hypothetical protein
VPEVNVGVLTHKQESEEKLQEARYLVDAALNKMSFLLDQVEEQTRKAKEEIGEQRSVIEPSSRVD